MTDKSEKRLSAIAHLHNALYLISRQKLFAAYASICRALEDSGEKLKAPEAIFGRFARICAGEEVNAEVQEINAELRKVTMNIPARFRGEPRTVCGKSVARTTGQEAVKAWNRLK